MASEIPTVDDLLKTACAEFEKHFGSKAEVAGCAPGRVNLIGEHTDYNEGFVFPMVSCNFWGVTTDVIRGILRRQTVSRSTSVIMCSSVATLHVADYIIL